jgi:hypothetical protein
MSISVRQTDSCAGPPSTPGVFFHTYFESVWPYNFNEVVGGDALVMMFVTNEADTRVTSITDVYGNTWTQIPGAQVSEVSSGGTQRSVDVWRADNVAAVYPYNPSTGGPPLLGITVNFTGTPSQCITMIAEVEGISGGAASAAVASSDTTAFSALTGPSLDGGSEAFFFTGGESSLFAFEEPAYTVDAPFFFGATGPGSSNTGNFGQESFYPAGAAVAVASGQQAATFRKATGVFNVPYAIVAVAIQAGTGGGGTPLSLDTTSLPDAHIGAAYSATLTASGGTGPYTFSIVSGSLPSGLSLNASTGVISGTPAYGAGGNFTLTIQVTDSLGAMASKTFALDSTALGGSWNFYNEEILHSKPASKTLPKWLPIKGF